MFPVLVDFNLSSYRHMPGSWSVTNSFVVAHKVVTSLLPLDFPSYSAASFDKSYQEPLIIILLTSEVYLRHGYQSIYSIIRAQNIYRG
jgi:hypothetical protein